MDKQTTNTIYPRKPNFSVASFQIAKRKESPTIWQRTGEFTSCAEALYCNTGARQGKEATGPGSIYKECLEQATPKDRKGMLGLVVTGWSV